MSSLKLSASQHKVMIDAVVNAIEHLDGTPTIYLKVISANLSEILLKLNKQAVEVKPKYSLKLSEAQKLALTYAKHQGILGSTQYLQISISSILCGIEQQVG